MATYRGVDGFLAFGGHLEGNLAPKVKTARNQGDTTLTLNATVTLVGVVAAGDTFTIAGETGTPTHTVTGGPYIAAANECGPITFTTAIAVGGAAQDAVVTFASKTVVNAHIWTLRSAVDTLDTTAFGASGYKSFVGGLVEWDGTGEAQFDYGDANQQAILDRLSGANPSSGSVSATMFGIIPSASLLKQFYGNVAISQFQITTNVREIVTAAFTFKGSGAITANWNT